jgi:16S rRNA (adenine1518-N6/adenine1519-N6)-dimethyltransferase
MPPLSPSSTRALLASLGHAPRHHLGQNFLVDGNIVRKSLELAGVAPGEVIVEVGPGLGTLTSALLEAGATVWAVERDARLFNHLRETLLPLHPASLHLLEGDAVEHPLAGLPGGAFKVVANLPYAISTPWMDGVLGGPLPSRMVLMLQVEAARRYAARPGGKDFGAISIFLQAAYEAAPGHAVSPACFYPAPKVESFLMHLVLRREPLRFAPGTRELIRLFFQHRRKQVGALARERLGPRAAPWFEALHAAGLSDRARPEEIPVPLWARLGASSA